jgi:hypothetical protein
MRCTLAFHFLHCCQRLIGNMLPGPEDWAALSHLVFKTPGQVTVHASF